MVLGTFEDVFSWAQTHTWTIFSHSNNNQSVRVCACALMSKDEGKGTVPCVSSLNISTFLLDKLPEWEVQEEALILTFFTPLLTPSPHLAFFI